MIHHAVLIKFRTAQKKSEIDNAFAELAGLKKKIPGILSFVGGPYSSPEGLNQGFTHGFVMTFSDAKARDGYLNHPEHDKVKAKLFPMIEGGFAGVIAFDFEA